MPFRPDRGRLSADNFRVIEISGGMRRVLLLRGKSGPLDNTECRVMLEASPTSSFIMPKAEFLFQILIVALDAPTRLRDVDQSAPARARGQSGEPVFRGFRLSFGPIDQTPFLRPGRCPIVIAMCGSNAYGGEARCQRGVGSLSPGHAAPGTGGQTARQLLRGNRFSFVVTTDQRRRPSVFMTP
jgi:hypothetical protein